MGKADLESIIGKEAIGIHRVNCLVKSIRLALQTTYLKENLCYEEIGELLSVIESMTSESYHKLADIAEGV
ncbi:MAG: hypothetical protein HRT41_12850 [Campylobacteraceae bacterium]|nr:hypothetical protein [Campylobacteraceae bacterium]